VLANRYILIGGSGTVGKALHNGLQRVHKTISSKSIGNWSCKDSNVDLVRQDISLDPLARNVVIYALGKTNPRTEISELNWINFELPVQILTMLEDFDSLFVTFGSALESLAIYGENKYLSSKKRYRDLVETREKSRYLHFQLNTIYGGLNNHSHMLLGQLQEAIENKREIELSSGNQIREYHHIDDLIIPLVERIQSIDACGIQQLNHGSSITIREMTQSVMERFGLEHVLKFNTLADPKEDNYNVRPDKTAFLEHSYFRDTVSGIYDYLNERVRR